MIYKRQIEAITHARMNIGVAIGMLNRVKNPDEDLILEFHHIETRLKELEEFEEAKSVWSWK